MSVKRERSVNFSREGTDLLIKLIGENKNTIENKKSDAVTWSQKENCWKAIEQSFNSVSGVQYRTAKTLKIKYDGIKRETRKKSASIRAELYKTGGGPSSAPVLTPSEEKVKDMILLSVDGMESVLDSDCVPEIVPKEPAAVSQIINNNIIHKQSPQSLRETQLMVVDCEEMDDSENEPIMKNTKPTKVLILCENQQTPKGIQCKSNLFEDSMSNNWVQWNPKMLRSRKHPALSKPKPRRPFEKVADSKLELADIQKQILEVELMSKMKQQAFDEEERAHKREMWALEKQCMLNKLK